MDFIATLPGWAINGLVIGLFGGIAGAIGGLIIKAGYSWGRYVPIVGIAVAVALSNNVGVVDWIRTQALTPSAVSAMIKADNPGLYSMLETSFPNDYVQLTTRMTELLKGGGTTAQVREGTAEAMAQIRRKYAPMLGLASDADHAKIVNESIAFHQALLDANPSLCNQVAISGPIALMGQGGYDQIKSMIEPQAITIFQAAANATAAPTQRRPSTDDDWAELGDAMLQRGVTDAQFAAMQTLDPASPDLCPGLILMLQTLNAVETEGVKAVRADYVRDSSAS